MAREKKITVKPLLNQEVKGRWKSVFEEPEYPLYVEVTYDRRYTKFPFGDIWMTARFYELNLNSPMVKAPLFAVEKIIEYEKSRSEDFNIKGLSNRIKSYFSPHYDASIILLDAKISDALKGKLTVSEFSKWSELHIADRVKKGVDFFSAEERASLNLFLSTTLNLENVVGRNNVYSWLVLMSERQKERAVEGAYRLFRTRGLPPRQPLEGLSNYIEKKPDTSLVIDEIERLSAEIIDREIVMNFSIGNFLKLTKY